MASKLQELYGIMEKCEFKKTRKFQKKMRETMAKMVKKCKKNWVNHEKKCSKKQKKMC